MTPQEIVNRVYQVFVTEKTPRSMAHGKCVYGEPDTIGCAAACLFDDPVIRKALRLFELGCFMNDGETGFQTIANNASLGIALPGWSIKHAQLITELQMWHDTEDWMNLHSTHKLSQFARICRNHGIQYPGDIQPTPTGA